MARASNKKAATRRPAATKKKAPARRPATRLRKPAARPKKAAAKKTAIAKSPELLPTILPIEIEPGTVEATLRKVREELAHWVKKGRYTKVRFKLRGKAILPDIPVAAMLAAEALSFWWAGLLRVLLVNVGAGSVLDVELVSDADLEVGRGKQALLAGDLDRAIEAFKAALEIDRDSASAYLNLGIAEKLRGERDAARGYLEKAEQLDPTGPTGEEARRLLDQMSMGRATPTDQAPGA